MVNSAVQAVDDLSSQSTEDITVYTRTPRPLFNESGRFIHRAEGGAMPLDSLKLFLTQEGTNSFVGYLLEDGVKTDFVDQIVSVDQDAKIVVRTSAVGDAAKRCFVPSKSAEATDGYMITIGADDPDTSVPVMIGLRFRARETIAQLHDIVVARYQEFLCASDRFAELRAAALLVEECVRKGISCREL